MTAKQDRRAGHALVSLYLSCTVALCMCIALPAGAEEKDDTATTAAATTTTAVRESVAPTTEALELARESAPVRRLAAIYADADATTAQLEQLRSLDAESYAMRNDATAADLARFRRQRERILKPSQLREVRERLRREFADTLRTPKPEPTLKLDRPSTGTE